MYPIQPQSSARIYNLLIAAMLDLDQATGKRLQFRAHSLPQKENPVPHVDPFYSANEVDKPPVNRIFHNNLLCFDGRMIPQKLRRKGMGGYKLCPACEAINTQGR